MQNFRSLLAANGANLAGWTGLVSITGPSANGNVAVGQGYHNGKVTDFIARINPVAEPSAMAALAVGAWRSG